MEINWQGVKIEVTKPPVAPKIPEKRECAESWQYLGCTIGSITGFPGISYRDLLGSAIEKMRALVKKTTVPRMNCGASWIAALSTSQVASKKMLEEEGWVELGWTYSCHFVRNGVMDEKAAQAAHERGNFDGKVFLMGKGFHPPEKKEETK